MPETATTYQYLKRMPGSSYKQLLVLGRIFTWTIYTFYIPPPQGEGMSVEEIAAEWDIPVEAVREAIAYIESNPPEIMEDKRRDDAWMEATGMNDPNYKLNPHTRIPSDEEIARLLKL